ncbi:7056_t:CDS:1, partial [Dentiscutata erythropus]
DLGYLTRPLWDKKPKPWNVIKHYYASDIPSKELCKLHNWKPRDVYPKVFDAIIFSIELDLLEIRLKELWDVVDHFIILESNRTFTGKKKELYFAKNRNNFSWAESKIIYKYYDDLDDLEIGESPFENEAKLRKYMNTIINEIGVKPGDIVINSDVDEIPYNHTIDLLRTCEGFPNELHLEMREYIYSFEFFTGFDNWRANIKIHGSELSHYHHGRYSDDILSDAGWHCTFCFRYISDFKFKMTSYSHNDRVTSQDLLDDDAIQDKICQGKNIYGMFPEAYTFKELFGKLGDVSKSNSMVGLPKYLLENKDKFPFLLPGGCIRESGNKH